MRDAAAVRANNKLVPVAVVVAGLAAGLLTWAPWQPASPGSVASAASAQAGSLATGAPGPLVQPPQSPMPDEAASAALAQGAQLAPVNPLDTMIMPVFRATAQGDLALDAQTRVDVERIQALFEGDEALGKLQDASAPLPDKARRELRELYAQYAQYSQAVARAFPPGQDTESLDDAARQLAGLHELRQQYFGVERTEALFGEEEKTSRELLALMRQSKDTGLSMQDKAAQAQDAWKKNQSPQP